MGTTAEKLNSLRNTKADIKAALVEKGQEVDDVFSTYADTIRAIETGVDTSDATATAADILSDKTAYVNGVKVTGTAEDVSALADELATQDDLIAQIKAALTSKGYMS